MSKVYSFRLDSDNPREAQAIEVIDTWVSQGYSLRNLLTEALIKRGINQDNSSKLIEYMERLSELVQEIDKGVGSNYRGEEVTRLPVAFVDAMKKSYKQGIRRNT